MDLKILHINQHFELKLKNSLFNRQLILLLNKISEKINDY